MRVSFAAASFLIATAACSASGPDLIPTLTITSPQRGTTTDATMMTVTGTATDDGPVHVTVAGNDVAVAKDGSFSTTIVVPPGLSLIETHAIDKTGHDVRDVRAVLASATSATDGTFDAPVGAHASPAALQSIATALATAAEGIDFTAAAQGLNPIYNNGGCTGAVIDITSISIGSIDTNIAPQTGSLATTVNLHNVVVKLHVSFKVLCIGGSTTVTVSASAAHISGDLGVSAASGEIATSLPSDSVQLDGFNLQVSGVPGAITDLINSHVRPGVENALANMIKSKLPPLADTQLRKLIARPYSATVLGHETDVTMMPSSVKIDSNGLFAQADTTIFLPDGAGGMFAPISTPLTADMMSQSQGLDLAISHDVVNQLLSGLWAAGGFDKSLPTSQIAVLAALLDPDATTLDVKFSLPPMMTSTTDGKLQLAIGDMMVRVLDANGAELQKIALSLTTTLSAGPSQSNKVLLTVGQPTVFADVVEQDPNATKPLTDEQVQGIVTGVWGLVGDQANQAFSHLPMPVLANIQLGAPTVSGAPGFVMADLSVTQ